MNFAVIEPCHSVRMIGSNEGSAILQLFQKAVPHNVGR